MHGVRVRVYLDSVGSVRADQPGRSYSFRLDGDEVQFTYSAYSTNGESPSAVTRVGGAAEITRLDATQAMSGHHASVGILVGEIGGVLREMVECQDALRIEMDTGGGWECVFDGFLSRVSVTRTSSVGGYSWRLSLSADGIHKFFQQMWTNWHAKLAAGQSDKLTKDSLALQRQLMEDGANSSPKELVGRLLKFGVANLTGLSVRGSSMGMAYRPGLGLDKEMDAAPANETTRGFWQVGGCVRPGLWHEADDLRVAAFMNTYLTMDGPLWSVVQGLSEPDIHEMFVTYERMLGDPNEPQVPTLVFRPIPFPGGEGDDDEWIEASKGTLVLGMEGGPGVISISASKDDSNRANCWFWAIGSADDSSDINLWAKTVPGFWANVESIKRYGFASRTMQTSMVANKADWIRVVIPKLLRRKAYQDAPLPCLWQHHRTYTLIPEARIGVPMMDYLDGACGYIVAVQHSIESSGPNAFKASTSLTVERVVEGLGGTGEYPDAVRRFCAGLERREYLQDPGVAAARGEKRVPAQSANGERKFPANLVPQQTSPLNAPRRCGATHRGADFRMPVGTPLVAPCDGTFVKSISQTGGGKVAIFRGDDGTEQAFAHLAEFPSLAEGARIVAGVTPMGTSGNSGISTSGPHLHWQVLVKGNPVEPLEWIEKGVMG